MKRICAYCEEDKKLTKEHIWSKCLLLRMPELDIKFLDSKNVSFNSEMVIADVCEECNNTKLSLLDTYFCSLYDNYFKHYIEDNIQLAFTYNYDLLLRSLLKITFNSSRTVRKRDNFFSRFKDCILYGDEIREDVLIKLDLVLPSDIKGQKMFPKSARAARIYYKKENTDNENFIVRLVSVNSYYFYMIISKEETLGDDKIKEELMEILKIIPGTIIDPYSDNTNIKYISGKKTYETLIEFAKRIENSKQVFNKKQT